MSIQTTPTGLFGPGWIENFLVAFTATGDGVAVMTNGAQGINFHRGTWHGVLTPLHAPGLFAVIDRIGSTANLEEYRYAQAWRVIGP